MRGIRPNLRVLVSCIVAASLSYVLASEVAQKKVNVPPGKPMSVLLWMDGKAEKLVVSWKHGAHPDSISVSLGDYYWCCEGSDTLIQVRGPRVVTYVHGR